MPIYEYECQQCGKLSEHWQKTTDGPPENCPHCQGGPLRKIVSLSTFHLKGTGWYVTDYARKNGDAKNDAPSPKPNGEQSSSAASSSDESKPAESKSESKSESKAETKAESKPNTSTTDA
ncbi:MAG: zinc ribbon domain-containing protein [Candidatus Alcyoniella australis]|nr:zinc ribbon domain-containing protein [Candidatus Alcyoniella australis]